MQIGAGPETSRKCHGDSGGPSFLAVESDAVRKQRLVFVFSPNGVIPKHFWPEKLGAEFELKRILEEGSRAEKT